MKCFKHPARDACGFCEECNKALCHECVGAFKPPLCASCALDRSAANTTGQARTAIIKSVIFFVVSFLILRLLSNSSGVKSPIGMHLTLAFFYSGIPWGWSFLSRVFPVVVWGNWGFLIGYYFFKCIAALLIGIPIMIWNLVKIPYLLHKAKTEKELFQQIDDELSNVPE